MKPNPPMLVIGNPGKRKPPFHFPKGSQEARDYMARLRAMRGKKKSEQEEQKQYEKAERELGGSEPGYLQWKKLHQNPRKRKKSRRLVQCKRCGYYRVVGEPCSYCPGMRNPIVSDPQGAKRMSSPLAIRPSLPSQALDVKQYEGPAGTLLAVARDVNPSTKGPYPFKEMQERYRTFTDSQLHYARLDAWKAAQAMRGHDPVAEAWYMDDVGTIAGEQERRKRGRNPLDPDARCPSCGGELGILGALGNLMHYRCRQCGMDVSSPMRGRQPRASGRACVSCGTPLRRGEGGGGKQGRCDFCVREGNPLNEKESGDAVEYARLLIKRSKDECKAGQVIPAAKTAGIAIGTGESVYAYAKSESDKSRGLFAGADARVVYEKCLRGKNPVMYGGWAGWDVEPGTFRKSFGRQGIRLSVHLVPGATGPNLWHWSLVKGNRVLRVGWAPTDEDARLQVIDAAYGMRGQNPLNRKEAGIVLREARKNFLEDPGGYGYASGLHRGLGLGKADVVERFAVRPGRVAAGKLIDRAPKFGRNPYGPKARYSHVRQLSPRLFDPRSFRTIKFGKRGQKAVVGCPKGYFMPPRGCRIGTRVQSRLYPIRRKHNPAFPGIPPWMSNDPAFRQELAAYRKRHGTGPVRITQIKVPAGYPKYLSVYGRVPEIKYDAPPASNKGRRIHRFGEGGGRPPWLVTSAARGPKFLAMVGGTFEAKDWLYK